MTRGIKRDGAITRLCLPVAAWPARDRELWDQAVRPLDDPFEERGARAHLRPITNRGVAQSYGRWLHWLAASGEFDEAEAPGARITKERVRRYIAALKAEGNHPSTIALRLEHLRSAALVMDPSSPWDWLKRPAGRLRASGVPKRDKRSRLATSSELLDLGHHLMNEASRRRRPGERAVQFRDGLLIAFLALQPLRLANLAGLAIGRTLIDVSGRWMIVIPPSQTKTHAPIEVSWPPTLFEALERYLAQIRLILIRRGGRRPIPVPDALWVSAEGTPLSAKRINAAVKLHTSRHLGRAVNPHLFRDAAANTLAVEAPKHVRAAAPVLAHASLKTTERHYMQANSLMAQRALTEAVKKMRR
jgi:integrase/recombinase XerD